MENVRVVEKLLEEVVQSLPEYSISLKCTDYNYKECEFSFHDDETDKDYLINLSMIVKGYGILKKLWQNKKIFFDIMKSEEDWSDPANWDADIVDLLVQCSIFNEVIYG